MFLRAARHGEIDYMKGISANVMCGQEGYYGTSSFDVILDMDYINNKEIIDEDIEDENMLEELYNTNKDKDMCSTENLNIENNTQYITNTTTLIDDEYIPEF